MWYVVSSRNHSKQSLNLNLFKFISTLLSLSSIFILTACGGPPQNIDEGQESPSVVAVAADSTVNFGETLNGFTYQRTVTLQNLSTTVAASTVVSTSVLSAPFSFPGGSFPGTGGTCTSTLAPAAICTIIIDIAPTAVGAATSEILIAYNNGLADQTLSLTLTTTIRDPRPALLSFTPTGSFDYGTIAIGGFSDLNVNVTNSGELSATSITPTGLSSPFSISQTTCTASLAPASTCSLTLRFSPVAQNIFNQTLNLAYDDGVNPQSINKALQGEGRIAGFIAVDQGINFDFGIVNSGFSSDQLLTLRNTGGGNASTIGFSAVSAPLSIVSNTCPVTLTPGQSCNMTVRYSPTATTGLSQNLSVSFFDGFSNQNSVISFAGQGFANTPTLVLTAPAVTPSNQDTPTLLVGNLIDGVRVRLYRTAVCGGQVDNALSSATTLSFSPTMSEGVYEFHVRVEDESGNLSPCSTAAVAYEYDNTNPNTPGAIGLSTSFTTSSTTSVNFNWGASTSTDVVDYQVAISTNVAGGNANGGYDSKGITTSGNISGLTMAECQYYYVSVQAIDDVGLVSNHAVSVVPYRYDSSVPTAPSNLSEGADASDTNSATVSWTASTDACGITRYEVAVSEDTNTNGLLDAGEVGNVVAFSSVGNVTSHRYNGLNLTTGVNHYTSIRAIDTTGRESSVAVSQPWIIYNPSIELPDMIAWLDANDPTTILDAQGDDANSGSFSGTVATWVDKSGSAVAHNFTVSTAASEAIFDPVTFSLNFNGTNTGMTTANHNEINTAMVNQRNITVSFQTSGDIAARQVLYEEGGNIRGMNIYIANGQLYCGFYNTLASDGDGAQPFTWVNTAITTNTTYFVTWVFDYTNYTTPEGPDGSLDCYLNGAIFGSTPTTSRLFGHSGAVGLGHINGQTCYEDGSCPVSGAEFLGKIYEVMLFNNAPDAAAVSNVHTYLDNKWN